MHCGLASTVIKFVVCLVVCGGGKAVGLLVWDQHQLCSDVYSCEELSTLKDAQQRWFTVSECLAQHWEPSLFPHWKKTRMEQKWAKCEKKRDTEGKCEQWWRVKLIGKTDLVCLVFFFLVWWSRLLTQYWRKNRNHNRKVHRLEEGKSGKKVKKPTTLRSLLFSADCFQYH